MIIISHRGVSNGKDKNLENKPIVVEQRIAEGFNVEIEQVQCVEELLLEKTIYRCILKLIFMITK